MKASGDGRSFGATRRPMVFAPFRPASWPVVMDDGCSEGQIREYLRHNNRALTKDVFNVAAVTLGLVFFAHSKLPAMGSGEVQGLADRSLVYIVIAAFQLFIVVFSMTTFPAATPSYPRFGIISVIGYSAWLTNQILFLQLVFFSISAAGHALGNGALVSLSYYIALFMNTLGLILTVLFFALNWFREDWQRDVLAPAVEKLGSQAAHLHLFSHSCSLPLALLDHLYLRDRNLLSDYGMSVTTLVKISFVYGVCFFAWCKAVQHVFTAEGCLLYPFIKLLDTLPKMVVFVLVIGTFVSTVGYALSLLVAA